MVATSIPVTRYEDTYDKYQNAFVCETHGDDAYDAYLVKLLGVPVARPSLSHLQDAIDENTVGQRE